MFSNRNVPFSSTVTERRQSSWSFSSVPTIDRSISTESRDSQQPRQLIVNNLENNNRSWLQREPFRIPRPIINLPPQTTIATTYLPVYSTLPVSEDNPSQPTESSNLRQPPYTSVFKYPSTSTPYRVNPLQYQRTIPNNFVQRIRTKKFIRERTPGFCTTLLSGGYASVAALVYLMCLLALPIAKLVLGIIYLKQCPVNTNIPLYMIVAGSCGLTLVLLLIVSSTCSYMRSSITARKCVHSSIIFFMAFSRGFRGLLGLFLIVWFFFGNVWVFGVRYRVRTEPVDMNNPNEFENYCHPSLYWFAFYLLIATYFIALFVCFIKFCFQFFCCGACHMWKKAFS